MKERTHTTYKIKIQEVSTWRKVEHGEEKIDNFWTVKIYDNAGTTSFRVDSLTEFARELKKHIYMNKARRRKV